MKKKVISMVSLLLISVILCSVFSGCSAGGSVEDTYRGGLGFELKLDGSNNTFSEAVADNVVKSGTYTSENGIITFSEELLGGSSYLQTVWIAENDVLINEAEYRDKLSSYGRLQVTSGGISGEAFLYGEYEFSENGTCVENNVLTGEGGIHGYTLDNSGFVYIDNELKGYIYDGVLLSVTSLFIKENLYNSLYPEG